MTPEDEARRKERRYRQLKRWWNKLPPEQQRELTPEELGNLRRQGLIDWDDNLTAIGQLKLHQLEQLEWWAKSERVKRCVNEATKRG